MWHIFAEKSDSDIYVSPDVCWAKTIPIQIYPLYRQIVLDKSEIDNFVSVIKYYHNGFGIDKLFYEYNEF